MSRKLNKLGCWSKLAYWSTGEWQTIEERLNEVEYNPGPDMLFDALRLVGPGQCRVVIVGQDPYPRRDLCTGAAFSTPKALGQLGVTPSLVNIFKEYSKDLGYPPPSSGDLTPWCEQGVLLWNAYPSCAPGKPGSHHWEEWTYLTKEILEYLDLNGLPISIFLGKKAAHFAQYISNSERTIITSYPSPLGVTAGFSGSRIFSRCNDLLKLYGQPPIDWRLP